MKLQGIEMAIAAAVVGAGCAALVAALRRAAQRRQATDLQLIALASSLKTLQARVVELSRRTPAAQQVESISANADSDPEPKTLAVITAAATAFLGKAAQIRSTRMVPAATENVSPWSQQGRVIVQTSHNPRGRE